MKRILAALFVAALVAAPAPTVDADDGIPIDMNAQYECVSAVPHLPLDPLGDEITVRIALALDGVDEQTARDLIDKGEAPFSGVGVEHYVGPRVRFEIVDVEDLSDVLVGNIVSGFITSENSEGSDLMSQTIRHYRLNRPGLVRDHVHLATSRDIAAVPVGNAVLGINNCQGSIGIPSLSYTIGEVTGDNDGARLPGVPLTFIKDLDAKTFAHELGHAFGGQHHYADCAENAAFAVKAGLGDVCTLMFNDASLIGMRFSPVNSTAARGYAEVHLEEAPSSHEH